MSDDPLDIDELAESEAEPEPEKKAKPKKEKGPGLFSRIGQAVTAPVAKARPEQFLNWKGVGLFVAVFLLVWLFIVNWAPVRVVLWFWTVDIPKALAFVIDVALGALLMWLWIRWRARAKAQGEGAERK